MGTRARYTKQRRPSRRPPRSLISAGAIACLTGCLEAPTLVGRRCDEANACPSGLACEAGYCVEARDAAIATPDAGRPSPPDAGGPDAGSPLRRDCTPGRGFREPFDRPFCGSWRAVGRGFPEEGEGHVLLTKQEDIPHGFFFHPNISLPVAKLAVDVTPVTAPGPLAAGLACRADGIQAGYYFTVSSQGQWLILRQTDRDTRMPIAQGDDGIDRLAPRQRLEVECGPSQLRYRVNGRLVAEIDVQAPGSATSVGLILAPLATETGEYAALFDNFQVD